MVLSVFAQAEYGSVDINILLKFHPSNIFYYLPASKRYLSPSGTKITAFNSESLYKLKYAMVKKIYDRDWELSNKIYAEQNHLKELNIKSQKMLYDYSNTKNKTDYLDREFLKNKRKIKEEISKCKKNIKKLQKDKKEKLIADDKEKSKIIKGIFRDIHNAIKQIKRKNSLMDIIFMPSIPHSFPIKKKGVFDFCILGKNSFTADERKRFSEFLTTSYNKVPKICLDRNMFILIGGKDYTLEALKYIYNKNNVSKEFTDLILRKIGGSK